MRRRHRGPRKLPLARRRTVRHHDDRRRVWRRPPRGRSRRRPRCSEGRRTANEVAISTDKMITIIRTLGAEYFLALRDLRPEGEASGRGAFSCAPRHQKLPRRSSEPNAARRLRVALVPRAEARRLGSLCLSGPEPPAPWGSREPDIYGKETLARLHERLTRARARARRHDRLPADEPRRDALRLDRRSARRLRRDPPERRRVHAHVDRALRRNQSGRGPLRGGAYLEPRRARGVSPSVPDRRRLRRTRGRFRGRQLCPRPRRDRRAPRARLSDAASAKRDAKRHSRPSGARDLPCARTQSIRI